ncbi:MAG: damage-control phosphatase ARMT1 family protein [Dethiobacteria bacterium]
MRTSVDCVPCLIRQIITTLKAAGVKEEEHYAMVQALLPTIAALDPTKTPAENSSLVILETYRLLGEKDPFKKAKSEFNQQAFTFYNRLEKIIHFNKDPLLTALRVSVAGNVIDIGTNPDFDVEASIRQELGRGFRRSDIEDFREFLNKGGPLVVIGDNSGEIVFDVLLMAQLRNFTTDLYYVVKGGPIFNDATVVDAEEVGMNLLAKIVTTGSNFMGVVPECCGEEFTTLIGSAGVVLAKGQANYETLEGTPFAGDKTFFLLQAKCPVIARHLKVGLGDSVLVRNEPARMMADD